MREFIKYFLMFLFILALGLNIFLTHEEARQKGFSAGVTWALEQTQASQDKVNRAYKKRKLYLDSLINVCQVIKKDLETKQWKQRKK